MFYFRDRVFMVCINTCFCGLHWAGFKQFLSPGFSWFISIFDHIHWNFVNCLISAVLTRFISVPTDSFPFNGFVMEVIQVQTDLISMGAVLVFIQLDNVYLCTVACVGGLSKRVSVDIKHEHKPKINWIHFHNECNFHFASELGLQSYFAFRFTTVPFSFFNNLLHTTWNEYWSASICIEKAFPTFSAVKRKLNFFLGVGKAEIKPKIMSHGGKQSKVN